MVRKSSISNSLCSSPEASTNSNLAPPLWLIALGLATVYLVWGSTYLAIRVAVQTMPPFLMASTRFLVAGALLASILIALKRFRINRQQLWDNMLIGALLLLGGNGLVSWAQQEVPSGMTTLILSLNPLFVVIADWSVHLIFRDHTRGAIPNGLTFLGLAIGFAGLSVLIVPSLVANDSSSREWR